MVLQYSDFFFLSILPIVIQAAAAVYLWKIHKFIGKEMTLLLGGINGLLLLYDITIVYLIAASPTSPDSDPNNVTGWGLFIGFVMPIANAVLHFILQRHLARSLSFPKVKTTTTTTTTEATASTPDGSAAVSASTIASTSSPKDTDQVRLRDTSRDITRDIARDKLRDTDRDVHRDIIRDKVVEKAKDGKKEGEGEEEII